MTQKHGRLRYGELYLLYSITHIGYRRAPVRSTLKVEGAQELSVVIFPTDLVKHHKTLIQERLEPNRRFSKS
jgi:hypothetical protein